MRRVHQPGEGEFRSILPEDIEWRPFPAFPPACRLAVLVGEPGQPGPYVIRVKVPSGVKMMPHRHPEDRIYTVMSGVFYIGLGEEFDGDKVQAYPPGCVVILPGDTPHFHWAKSGEYVTQVTAIGPLGLEYMHSRDDPREQELVERVRNCFPLISIDLEKPAQAITPLIYLALTICPRGRRRRRAGLPRLPDLLLSGKQSRRRCPSRWKSAPSVAES